MMKELINGADMKKMIAAAFMFIAVSTVNAWAQQMPAVLVQAGVDAINKQDAAFFERQLADDVVWLDEDGHVIAGKMSVLNFVKRQLLASPVKLVVSALRTGSTSDAAWATYAYTLDKEGKAQKKGMSTIVYKRA